MADMSWRVLVAAMVLTALFGCKGVTEHGSTGDYGVTVLDADDLTVLGSMSDMSNGQLVVSMGGSSFIVLCSDGKIYHCDSEALAVDSISSIPAGGGGGFSDAVKITGSLYLSTGGATLLDVSLADFTVQEEFAVGSAVADICASPTGEGLLYVLDAADGKLREVFTLTNTVKATYSLGYENPVAVEGFLDSPASLVIGYDDADGTMTFMDLEEGYEIRFASVEPYSCGGVRCYQQDSLIYAVRPIPGGDGYLSIFQGWGVWLTPRSMQLDGSPVDIALDPDGSFSWVLTSLRGGEGKVFRVDSDSINYGITHQVELEGLPMDITSHAGGEKLLILTVQ
jgi:hypothetical protein